MFLHGCNCDLRQRGFGALGSKIVPAHLCWDGKTMVINDADCPPQPVAAPAPAPYVPPSTTSIPEPAPYVPPPVVVPDSLMPVSTSQPELQESLPTVSAAKTTPDTYQLVDTAPASGGTAVPEMSAAVSEDIEPASEFNIWPWLAVAAGIYFLSQKS